MTLLTLYQAWPCINRTYAVSLRKSAENKGNRTIMCKPGDARMSGPQEVPNPNPHLYPPATPQPYDPKPIPVCRGWCGERRRTPTRWVPYWGWARSGGVLGVRRRKQQQRKSPETSCLSHSLGKHKSNSPSYSQSHTQARPA